MALKNPAQQRAALIAKVHALAKKLGYDEATYRTVLLTQTGKTSCRQMSDRQLSRLAEALDCLAKGKSLPEAPKPPSASAKGLAGQALPTAKQWETLAGLSARAGWGGLHDFRLLAFARHTAKVADLGELSRSGMSAVITGLSRRLAQQARAAHEEGR
ncbi:DUF1018 domain-containing protein [Aromatoleum toluvorans]|uniref:DUF1018 domain-containing protein n=1 Tax=Aromatoleum toluvorans TaxID=92002 RepID=A0ABX1Q6C2_9RHOO|nr:phage protein GemA/Gp16 family protein [Aromatoleum toluvorans]NMG46410.1 DUF1018 domain-containing protein [Aromatoleum toluvorans]